jgi:hypothetical protein
MSPHQSVDLTGVLIEPQTFVGDTTDLSVVAPIDGEPLHVIFPKGDVGRGSPAVRLHPAGGVEVPLMKPLAGVKLVLACHVGWHAAHALLLSEVAAAGFVRALFDQRISHPDGRMEFIWAIRLPRSPRACEVRTRHNPAPHRRCEWR